MADKAVVVFDQNNRPVPVYEVQLFGYESLCQNPDGYFLYEKLPSGSTYIRVLASDFKPAVYPVSLDGENQTIRFGGTQIAPNDIMLPALRSSFNKPSRESIINVKANLCNLRDADDIPIFEPFISSLIANGDFDKANDWVTRAKESGATHFHSAISIGYPEYLGWTNLYPIPAVDLMNRLDEFNYSLNFIKANGLIPIIKLAFDGQVYSDFGLTYGWLYGIQNLQRIADSLRDSIDDCLWSTGFDGCFPDWSRDQTLQMIRLMRSLLGDKCCIDTEFGGPGSVGYCHMGQGAADWSPDKLGLLDHFSIEVNSYPADPDGVGQTATRLLGDACNIGPKAPYYLQGLEKTIAIDYYETCAFQAIRKQISPADAVKAANFGKSYGFSVFGNGIPS